jgi:hypothetical protein
VAFAQSPLRPRCIGFRVGAIARSADEPGGFDWVAGCGEDARSHAHLLDQLALGKRAVVVQQLKDLKLPGREVLGGGTQVR